MTAKRDKYTLVTVSGIHTQIAVATPTMGYSKGIMEIFFPDDDEMKNWTKNQTNKWISDNNKRMVAICDFLNSL